MNPVPINLAVEDVLSEAVLLSALQHSGRSFNVGTVYGKKGNGYLRKTIQGWNRAARSTPLLLLTDLDECGCAPALVADWLPLDRHPNLIFRVAVREVEAWLLADTLGIMTYLRCKRGTVLSSVPEDLVDPKAEVIRLANLSGSRQIREEIVPRSDSGAIQGRGYNICLMRFVRERWDIEVARQGASSLDRLIERLRTFNPTWEQAD